MIEDNIAAIEAELALMRERFNLYNATVLTGTLSETYCKKNILGMSDEEIMHDLQERMIEGKISNGIKGSDG